MDLRSPQTGVIHIHSDQGEGSLTHLSVRVTKDALHEAHVGGQKREPPFRTCAHIRFGYHTANVRQADEPVEVGDGAWFLIYGKTAKPRCKHVKEWSGEAKKIIPSGNGCRVEGAVAPGLWQEVRAEN